MAAKGLFDGLPAAAPSAADKARKLAELQASITAQMAAVANGSAANGRAAESRSKGSRISCLPGTNPRCIQAAHRQSGNRII